MSTFTQRWTSVNDLTSHTQKSNQAISTFFLQSQSTSSTCIDPQTLTLTIRPSQSLISLIELPTSPPPPVPPRPKRFPLRTPTQDSKISLEDRPLSSSRVAEIIHRFESQNISSMNKTHVKVSPMKQTNLNRQYDRTRQIQGSSKNSSPVPIEISSLIVSPTKKCQPIIVYERITNHNRLERSSIHSVDSKHWSDDQDSTSAQIESDSDSAIHTMVPEINRNVINSSSLSRSNTCTTTDSTCSSSSTTSHLTLPNQNQIESETIENCQTFEQNSSPNNFIEHLPRTTTEYHDDHDRTSSSLSTRFYSSETNLLDQYRRLSTTDAIRSETNLSQNRLINRNMPLKYKRDSLFRLYGPNALQQHTQQKSHDVVLEDDIDPPFSPRTVTVRKNKSIHDEYELLEFLGRGKFGEVKKCREKSTKHLLAAKFIQIHKEQDRIEALNEIEIMKALQHPRLLQLYDAFESKAEICLIMELIIGGELFERVIDDDFILTERLCELYMMQICEGVLFMHQCNIIHLDMKPENILCLNRDGHRIKIIDFGLARKFDPIKQLKVLFGTPEFVAPEVINFDRIGFGTDMWSVGVICYVLLSGLSPFMGENDNETYANINRVSYDFDDEAFTDISDEAKDFISKLLVKNKDQRLLAPQCLAHPWLTRRPKLPSTPKDEETAEKKLSTKKLRRFVIRRRWQKAVNALLALKRMGMTL